MPIYGPNFFTGGIASADNDAGAGYTPDKAFNGNGITDWWSSQNTAMPHWIQYDLGAGVSKRANKLRYFPKNVSSGVGIKNFKLQGSNNGTGWTDIYTGVMANTEDWQEFEFSNSNSYRYYRVYIIDVYDTGLTIGTACEIEAMEAPIVSSSRLPLVGVGP